MSTYTQCLLSKGKRKGVAWIPTNFAKADNIIKVWEEESWDDGWKIDCVYNERSKEHIESHERDCLKQRKASDI